MVNVRKPATRKKGLKVLAFGETFVGKTYFALTFPGIKAIDSEDGYGWYEGEEAGKNLQGIVDTQSFYDVEEFLDELEEDKDIKTLVIDSETKVYENIQETLLNEDEKRARRKGGNELDANISMRSWGKIKQLSKRLQNAKIRLATQGVNVVSVAQSADVMKDTGSNTRIKVGTRPDMQKKADYDYDLEIRLYVEDGKYMGEILKDRTHVTHQGDKIENPSYEIWKERVEGKSNQGKTVKKDFVADSEKAAEQYNETLDKADILDDEDSSFADKLKSVIGILKSDDDKKKLGKDLLAKTGAKSLNALTAEQQKIAVKVLRKYADKAV